LIADSLRHFRAVRKAIGADTYQGAVMLKEQARYSGLARALKTLYSMFPEVWIWGRLTWIWCRVRQKGKGV
jgi:hypothetical protein